MLDFLSDVFEFDVDTENDTIVSGPLTLKLVETSQKNVENGDSGITFAFKLKKNDQIKELLNKYKFFLYRKAQDPHNEKFKFYEDYQDDCLKIKDFDGRTWQFDLLPGETL